MPTAAAHRYERFHDDQHADREDQRAPAQRDRDRILYTVAFRRLAGVTQVVSPTEGLVLHNRLTHSLEVAQIARRLAEKLIKDYGPEHLAYSTGGLDPEVAEAAALAHDLGHPPFGHITEQELNCLSTHAGLRDGFNGNAQSFRIVTRLEVRRLQPPGLNLTRATLNAILKYPRLRPDPQSHGGWGAYDSEQPEFTWARKGLGLPDERTLEAEIMDWADDVAYAVHDVEDFYRAGLVPIDRLTSGSDEVEQFLEATFARQRVELSYGESNLREAFRELVNWFELYVTGPYSGTLHQRAGLRALTAHLIDRYINAVDIPAHGGFRRRFHRQPASDMEVTMLKALTWYYVIDNPALAAQQHGQRRVIRFLFDTFLHAASRPRTEAIFPTAYKERLDNSGDETDKIRVVVDLIASMTEGQVINSYQVLAGGSSSGLVGLMPA